MESVPGQQQCQELCESEVRCVGYAYSRDKKYARDCNICKTDNLTPVGNKKDFYRKPTGKTLKFIYTFKQKILIKYTPW